MKKKLLSAALAACGVIGILGTAAWADPDADFGAMADYPHQLCVTGGPTAADRTLAAQLNQRVHGSLHNRVTAERVSCARQVVAATKAHPQANTERAAVIAVTTTIVESTILNVNQELDHDSLGLFQQRASWGSRAQRLNPAWATGAFLNKMVRIYPNGSWKTAPIGQVCQDVQVSAFGSRYQPQAADAATIVAALWQPTPPPDLPGGVVGGKLVDFDGDGKPDVLGFDYRGDGLYLTHNASEVGTPVRGTSVLVRRGWTTVDNFMLADYDGDGKVDILGRLGDTMAVWLNTSTPGRPSTAELIELGTGWHTLQDAMMGDFTGDGKPDIVGFALDGNSFWVIPNTSTPGMPSRGVSMKQGDGWRSVSSFMLVDFDGDGKTDILGRVGDAMYSWRNLSADGRPVLGPYTNLGTGWNALSETMVADFTGDGKPDILGYTKDGNSLWVNANASTPGTLALGASIKLGDGWRTVNDVMLADFDGDGKTDIVGQHTDHLFVWLNTSANGRPGVAPYVDLGTGWNSIGDFLTAKPQF